MNYIITSTEKVMFWLMFVHLWSQPLVNFLKLDGAGGRERGTGTGTGTGGGGVGQRNNPFDFEADPDKQTDPGVYFVTYL